MTNGEPCASRGARTVREGVSQCACLPYQMVRRANETRSIYEADIEDLRRQYDTLWEAANGILAGLAKIK